MNEKCLILNWQKLLKNVTILTEISYILADGFIRICTFIQGEI